MGDDVVDLAVLARVGLSAAPADAVAEVRSRVALGQRRRAAAHGAARELIEMVLRAQNRWDGDRRRVRDTSAQRAQQA